MPVVELQPGARLDGGEAGIVVCVPVFGAHDMLKRCLTSLVAHTPAEVPILVADDADPDPGAQRWLRDFDAHGALRHTVHWMRQPANLGFPGNVNAAFAAAGDADVVLVNSDVEVAEGWLDGLREAAYSDDLIATACTLANSGTIVSVPYRNHPVAGLPPSVSFERAAARVRSGSARLRPRLPTAIGHCLYVRRTALQLVGGFDEVFAPGYGEEVDFSQRCLSMGLQHVLADDVLVLHRGGASLDEEGTRNPVQEAHEEIVRRRYPWYEPWVEEVESSGDIPLSRSLAIARRAILRPTVTVDGRCLGPVVTGTQVNVLEFVHALHRRGEARIRVVVPHDLGEYAQESFARMTGVELLGAEGVGPQTPRDDVVHRPFQVTMAADLLFLRHLGDRLIITQQDLIAYRNPAYFASATDWLAYRRLTRETLALADLVFFSTPHAAADALAEAVVDERRHRVVALGTDFHLGALQAAPAPPEDAARLGERRFLLCLGTDYLHKNRPFALRLLHELRTRHGWDGQLVLAGPQVAHGSSAAEEATWLAEHRDTAAAVVRLPAVREAEKQWLLEHAAALVYPTTYEGFGFIPFEAAGAGLPCFFAHTSSLRDTLGEATAVIVPWDVAATADRAIGYLTDPERARQLVAEIRACAERLPWETTAERASAAYEDAVRMPTRAVAALAAEALEVEDRLGEIEGRFWELWHLIGPTGLSLVGPDGRLPEEARRALSGLMSRPATRGPLLAALRLAGRVRGGRDGAAAPVPVPASAASTDDDEDEALALKPPDPPVARRFEL
jgi:GT2 family glycosyltransferase/glycosyltransferase involved in cell wall biosynthesis